MNHIYKKYLKLVGVVLLSTILISCSMSDNNSSNGVVDHNIFPLTLEAGKFTVTVLDFVYINNVYTVTLVVESDDGYFDNFYFFASPDVYSLTFNSFYTKKLDANQQYVLCYGLIENKTTPDILNVKFELKDKTPDNKQAVTSNNFKFQKNVVSDFENVQARELDYTIQTVDGEIKFNKVLYYEGRIAVFANFIGYNDNPILIENRYDESENYYFKIEGKDEEYSFASKAALYKNDSAWKASPQNSGHDENITWYISGYIEIPINNQITKETLILNVYEYSSNELVGSVELENINLPLYEDN